MKLKQIIRLITEINSKFISLHVHTRTVGNLAYSVVSNGNNKRVSNEIAWLECFQWKITLRFCSFYWVALSVYSIRVPFVFVVRMIVIRTDMPDEIAWVGSNSVTTMPVWYIVHFRLNSMKMRGLWERTHSPSSSQQTERSQKLLCLKNEVKKKEEEKTSKSGLYFDCFSFSFFEFGMLNIMEL